MQTVSNETLEQAGVSKREYETIKLLTKIDQAIFNDE